MNSSLVKLLGRTGLLGLKSKDNYKINPTDVMCVQLHATKMVKINSKGEEEEITDGIIETNQSVILYPAAHIFPSHFHLIVGWNPELTLQTKSVTALCPIVSPGSKGRIGIVVSSRKKININELDYVFELFMLN